MVNATDRVDAKPRLAGAYAMDTEQSDIFASPGGIRGGVLIRARAMGQPYGGGAHRGVHSAGRTGWAPCPEKADGHAGWRATGHPGRSHDRERVLHLFRGGWDGVALATGFIFCARRSNGLPAGASDEIGTFRVGCERHAADLVGKGSSGIALEPRFVRGDEVLVLVRSGVGASADAWAGGTGGRTGGGCAYHDPRGRECTDVDDGSVLSCARTTRSDRRMEIHCGKRGASARGEQRRTGGPVKGLREVRKVDEINEVKEISKGVAAV